MAGLAASSATTAGSYSNPVGVLIGRLFLLANLVLVIAWPGPLWLIVAFGFFCIVADFGMRRKGVAVSQEGLDLRYMFWSARMQWGTVAGFETASGSRDAPRTGDHLYVLSTVRPAGVVRWPGVVERVRSVTPQGAPVPGYRIEVPGLAQGAKMRTPTGDRTRDVLSSLEADLAQFRGLDADAPSATP